ncbi:MAG: iron-containing alcohol dehydrogenase [Planctomycetes bacterium]|nr:iron-containing alcohol dehydrogenase [Planctomycetota bacterium]
MQPYRQQGIHLYHNPVHVAFGCGALARLGDLFSDVPARQVLVVSTPGVLEHVGGPRGIQDLLPGRGLHFFHGISPNPQVREIQDGILFGREKNIEAVIGLGGGSAMDTAKIIAMVAPHPGSLEDYLLRGRRFSRSSLFTVMIPTTAGTGSEVTRWATAWDMDAKKKYSLESPEMYPRRALVDPALTRSLPADQTAATGFDALSHAFEASWSVHANPISDIHARQAIRLIFEHLPGAVAEPENETHRTAMALAATVAGLAFSNTKTAAAHSISYPMTIHFGTLHGQATGVLLAPLLRFNSAAVPDRMQAVAEAAGASSASEAAAKTQRLLQQCGLAVHLRDLGIDRAGIDRIVADGFTPDRMNHNARPITESDLRNLLTEIS